MTKQFNRPTVQFCIQATIPGTSDIVDRFTIEQNEGPRKDRNRENRLYNAVQLHLDDLANRNHLDYQIVRWGDVKDRSVWLSGEPFPD